MEKLNKKLICIIMSFGNAYIRDLSGYVKDGRGKNW